MQAPIECKATAPRHRRPEDSIEPISIFPRPRKGGGSMRPSGRRADALRPVRITRGYTRHAEGSVLVEFGDTKVLCTASVEGKVPGFLRGKQSGRTQEIQRLIGRALRSVVELSVLGENSIQIDCDVLQADGGTRTAS